MLLFVLDSVGGCMEGTLPMTGVLGCFDELPWTEEWRDVVELLKPPERKLDNILTGDPGLKDFDLSPSRRMGIAFKTLE